MTTIAIISLIGSNAQHNCVLGLVKCMLDDGINIDFFTPPQFKNLYGFDDPGLNFIQPSSHPYLVSLARSYIRNYREKKYFISIFLDNPTLKLFPILKGFVNKSIYFQLEITDKKYCKTFNDKVLKWYETYAIKRSNYVITQDLWRASYCAGEYGIPLSNFLIIPNSPISVNGEKKSNYIRKLYNIPDEKIIVGYIGMIDEYTVPEWLCDQLKPDEKIQFFFHTHKKKHPYYQKIKSRLEKVAIVSDEFIPSTELDQLYTGIDIGLAIGDYNGLVNKYTSINQDLSGYSYGKVNWYLSLGKPVIYSYKISFRYLEKSNCGLQINRNDDLQSLIQIIKNDYNYYSSNCINYFNHYLLFDDAFLQIKQALFNAQLLSTDLK